MSSVVKTRVILGTLMIAGFVGILLFDYFSGLSAGFCLLLGTFTILSLREFSGLFSRRGIASSTGLCIFFGLLLILCKWILKDLDPQRWLSREVIFPGYAVTTFIAFSFFSVLFLLHLLKGPGKERLEEIAVSLFGFVYVVFFLGFLHDLRTMELKGVSAFGLRAVLLVVLVAKAGDMGAFFFGRAWGKHKLYTAVSPNKTVEGAGAGLLCSALACLGLTYLLGLSATFSAGFSIALGVLVGAAAQTGDLVESLFKRVCNVKDSGALLPAFGGSLDMVDCLILSGPVGYFSIQLYCYFL